MSQPSIITGTTWLVLLFSGLGPFDSAPSAAAETRLPSVTLAGRVTIDGEAAPGAVVYLRESPEAWSSLEASMRPVSTRDLAKTTADDTGFFEFKDVPLTEAEPGREFNFPVDVIARVPGRGIAWRHVEAPTQSLELNLPDERKVVAQSIDHDGRPAAGIRLSIREIADPGEPWHASLHSPGYLNLDSSEALLTAVSDANGQCVLRGLPPDVLATVVVDDGRYLRSETFITTAEKPQRELTIWPAGADRGQPRVVPVQLWLFKLQLERAYRVHGRVVFADTGQPAAGAGWNKPPISSPPAGLTGADGRFELDGLGPGKISLHTTAPAGSGYLSVATMLELSGDNYEVEHTVELPRGEVVRGRVVDASNGRGLGGASIWYAQPDRPWQPPQPFVEKATSAADGSFAMAVFPGEAELIVAGSVPGYLTHNKFGLVTEAAAEFHRPINVRAGQPHEEVTFELQPKPNAALAARVVDADGNPVEGAEITYQGSGIENGFGMMTRPAVRTTSDADGSFVFYDIEPSLDYHVRIADHRRGLGSYIVLSKLDSPVAPLTIALKPLAAAVGRVVSEDGRPIAGAVVRLYRTQGRSSRVDAEPVATDNRGSFELPGLLPGAIYWVQTSADGYATRQDEQFTPLAGESFPLGDKVLPRTDQEISGVLVDADGKPVVGARVFAWGSFAAARFRARTLVRLTDSEGRFRLSGLPHGNAMVSQSFDQFDTRQSILGTVTAGAMNLRLVVKDTTAAKP